MMKKATEYIGVFFAILARRQYFHLAEKGVFDFLTDTERYVSIRPADVFFAIYITGIFVLTAIIAAVLVVIFVRPFALTALSLLFIVVIEYVAAYRLMPVLTKQLCEWALKQVQKNRTTQEDI